MDDSGARGAPRGPPRGEPRACGSPPRRRRCSSARSGSAHRGGARGPHDTPQRAGGGAAPATGAGRLIRRTRSRSSRSTSACPRPTRRGASHDDEIDSGATRARQASEALAEEPAGTVPLDGSADPTAHRQAETVEGLAVGGGHQEEQATVEARATLERGIELGSGPEALAGKEAHVPARSRPAPQTAIRFRPFWRRRFRTSCPPFVRMRTRKPWVRFRRRLFGWNVLFIGEPHGPRRRNVPPGGTNSEGYRSGGPPVKRRPLRRGRAALYTPGSCGTFPRSRISHDSGLLHGSQSPLFHNC